MRRFLMITLHLNMRGRRPATPTTPQALHYTVTPRLTIRCLPGMGSTRCWRHARSGTGVASRGSSMAMVLSCGQRSSRRSR
jgi:hypothetical protein